MTALVVVPAGKPVCVYAHSIEGRVVYVGKGLASRPFLRTSRSPAWHARVEGADLEVTILRWFATEEQATAAEADAIRRLRPELNLVHNGYVTPETTREGARRANAARVWTPESKARLSVAIARRRAVNHVGRPLVSVRCVETNVVYPSIRATAEAFGVSEVAIHRQIKGEIKTVKQHTFERAT